MSICLNMIVKDEAHVLPRTLPLLCRYFNFSYWVISDTGSTDGTQGLIRSFFAERGISGELIETPWKHFGHNRTVALQAAYNKTDYVLVWDADDSIVGNFRLPEKLQGDVYEFEFGAPGEFKYSRMQLFNNRKRWKYVGVLHEHPAPEEPMSGITHVTGNYYFVSGREGSRNKDPDKYKKDAAVLEEGLREEPENARYAFYCGNSYLGAQDYENALRMYKRVLTMNGWSEEKYMSCLSGFGCYEKLGRAEEGLYMLVDAGRYSPERIEAAFYLIRYYANREQNKTAMMYYTQIQEHYEANHASIITARYLFANHHDYVFYLPYYMIIVALKLDNHDLALRMFDIILHHRYILSPVFYIRCLFQNFFLIKDIPPSQARLQAILEYRNLLPAEGFEEIQNRAIANYTEKCQCNAS